MKMCDEKLVCSGRFIRIRVETDANAQWDEYVERHPLGWISHLSSWKRAIEEAFPHIKGHCLVLQDAISDQILGGMPVYLVSSRFKGNRLVSVPFSTLCDPLLDSPDLMEPLWIRLEELRRRTNATLTEIRTFQCGLIGPKTLPCQVSRTYVNHSISLDRDLSKVFAALHRTSTKQAVRRALRTDLRLELEQPENARERFYELYQNTRKKIGLPPLPVRFFDSLWKEFHASGKVKILSAKLGDRWVAALLVYAYKGRMSAEALGWDTAYADLNPTWFLFWQAIKLAHESGFRVFDFGRTHHANKGLMDYKRRWGADAADLPIYYLAEDSKVSVFRRAESALGKNWLMKQVVRYSPDALVRLIGEVWYRNFA